jgi:hypothetical protein
LSTRLGPKVQKNVLTDERNGILSLLVEDGICENMFWVFSELDSKDLNMMLTNLGNGVLNSLKKSLDYLT